MAITATKKGNLVDTEISQQINEKEIKSGSKNKKENQPKPKSFLGTTMEEIKKVSWPSFSYVIRWSIIIVLFTAIFAIVLGYFDHAFASTMKFVDCTSPKSRNRPVSECTTSLLNELIYR